MTRNTERRIEVACPVLDREVKWQINHAMDAILLDNVKARIMKSDGMYIPHQNNRVPLDSQLYFMQKYSHVAFQASPPPQKIRFMMKNWLNKVLLRAHSR
ncbi:hypothetical protein [Aminipila butyrica]|uniref:hypothetical protein n=1 Tax=Aminipila butyrica TaxID=433296 RepID=UPI001FEC41F2|nr:hypothetical protein [Aminipila butyrica]